MTFPISGTDMSDIFRTFALAYVKARYDSRLCRSMETRLTLRSPLGMHDVGIPWGSRRERGVFIGMLRGRTRCERDANGKDSGMSRITSETINIEKNALTEVARTEHRKKTRP